MASFYDLPKGKGIEFDRILADAGLSGEDAMRVLRDHSLGKVMVDALHAVPIVYRLPSWYVGPKSQIKRVKQLLDQIGCVTPIPDPPANFTPRTSTEVLMLAAYLSADSLHAEEGVEWTNKAWWDFIEPPKGYTKYRWEDFRTDPEHLRLVLDETKPDEVKKHHFGVCWVAFDPNANHGKSPRSCWNNPSMAPTLASAEVLMALALFPRWALSWNGESSPYPNMSGYQYFDEFDWNMTSRIVNYGWGRSTFLKLTVNPANSSHDNWSNPTVREL